MRFIMILTILAFVSCSKKDQIEKNNQPVKVATTNFPIHWMCKKLLGDTEKVNYLIPPDIDPAFWQPSQADVQSLLKSKKILINGATFEKWLGTISLPKKKIVDTTVGLKSDFITIKNAVTHEHNGHTHSHDGTAFTTWLQEKFIFHQLAEVSNELQICFPEQTQQITANENNLKSELKQLHTELKEAFSGHKKFLASHPIYQYLARDHKLDVKSFLWEPEVTPSDEEWQKLIAAKSHSTYMLWEDQPSKEISKKLDQAGIKIIVFRQCGNIPPSGDYIEEMKSNIANLKKITDK